jgi:hypothetical protein
LQSGLKEQQTPLLANQQLKSAEVELVIRQLTDTCSIKLHQKSSSLTDGSAGEDCKSAPLGEKGILENVITYCHTMQFPYA